MHMPRCTRHARAVMCHAHAAMNMPPCLWEAPPRSRLPTLPYLPHSAYLPCLLHSRLQVSPSLLKMMRTIALATPSVCNIMLVLCVFIFFYAQVGTHRAHPTHHARPTHTLHAPCMHPARTLHAPCTDTRPRRRCRTATRCCSSRPRHSTSSTEGWTSLADSTTGAGGPRRRRARAGRRSAPTAFGRTWW